MRYKAILDHGRIQYIDTLRPITHVVIGQHNEKADQPEKFRVDPDKLTDEEQLANSQHRLRLNSGHYNMSALDWTQDEDTASARLADWQSQGLINLRILPATRSANG